MYVCVCSAVTDRQIHEAVDHGAATLCDVQSRLPVGMCLRPLPGDGESGGR